jgi:hypothetical protein
MVLRYAHPGRERCLPRFVLTTECLFLDECARLKQHFEAMTKDSKVSLHVVVILHLANTAPLHSSRSK